MAYWGPSREGHLSHRPASTCPGEAGRGQRASFSAIRLNTVHQLTPPSPPPPGEGGIDTGGGHRSRSLQAEVWQAGSEGDLEVTHPSHTFFFEICRGEGGAGEERHPAVLTPPLGSKLSASPPRSHCGAAHPRAGGPGGPPAPARPRRSDPRRCRPAGAGGATPGKEGKRAGRGGGARAVGASSLLHCRGAIFPRLRPAGGLGPAPTTAPPGTAFPRGHCTSRRGALAAVPHTCAAQGPVPPMGGYHRLRSPVSLPCRGDALASPARSLAAHSGPRPIGVRHGAIRLRRACSWGKFPFPSPRRSQPQGRTGAPGVGGSAPTAGHAQRGWGCQHRELPAPLPPRRLRHPRLAAPIVRRQLGMEHPRKAKLACPAAAKPTPWGRLRTDKASEKR